MGLLKDDVFEELKPKGFIADFSSLILENIPTSPDWAEAIALTAEATVLSKVKVLTKIGPLSLNVWNLMIGPSGLAYKSTPILYFVYPTLAAVTGLINKPIIMPGRFSVEGMIEYLSMKHKKGKRTGDPMHDEGIIVRDEFTSLFKAVYSKGYLADAMEFLSELYDGTMQKRYTRKMKLEQSEHVYICLLAATTPYLFSVMERNFFIQGTGNRVLFTMFEPVKLPVIDAEDFFISGSDYRERVKGAEVYARRLAGMYDSKLRYIFPLPQAGDIWARYKTEKDKEAAERYRADAQDLQYSYIQRLPETTLKLAGLATVSRAQKTIQKLREDTLMIREDDMRWAIVKTERHLDYFRELLDKWTITPVSKPVETEEKDLVYMLNFIRDNPDQLLSQQELLVLSRKSKGSKWYELVNTLIDMGFVKKLFTRDEIGTIPRDVRERHGLIGFKGQPPVVYRFVPKGER